MGRLCTPPPDPNVTVQGCGGTFYHCPDIPTVDRQIAHLTERIVRNPPKFPRLADLYRTDIDLLLDRRLTLAALGEVG